MGSRTSPDHDRPHDQDEQDREPDADPEPVVAHDALQVDRQAEDDERDDLGQARQRAGELLDLPLVRRALVADHDAGDEDGEEARALEAGGQPVEPECETPRSAPGRGPRWAAAPGASAAAAASRRPDPRPPRRPSAGRSATAPLPAASQPPPLAPSRLTMIAMPTGSFAPDSPSSRVPERPVISRLPEHGEHHRRVGRCQGGADEQRGLPLEAEDRVRQHGECGGGDDGAGHTQPGDARQRGPHPVPADVHAAVEEDQHQRHRDDPLVGDDRDLAEARHHVRGHRGARSGRAPAPGRAAARPAGWSRRRARTRPRRAGRRARTGSGRPSASSGVVGTTADQTSRRTAAEPTAAHHSHVRPTRARAERAGGYVRRVQTVQVHRGLDGGLLERSGGSARTVAARPAGRSAPR